MNINCTSKCAYQSDGKCTMDQVPYMAALEDRVMSNDIDCPYFYM